MNGPGPKFWVYLKRTMLILAALSLAAAVVIYLTFTGLKQTFFALCFLLIAANFLLIYLFARHNDSKRPGSRDFGRNLHAREEKESFTEHSSN